MKKGRNSHIIIAGTGRAGTTFLVRYLTELGFDTQVSRQGLQRLDGNANAGLEDMLLVAAAETLPYVIKTPWIGDYVDEILDSPDIRIDAAILPVRDLVEAAASRTILELRALHQNAPWMAERLGKTWENWAVTPGGTVFSLNPMDQARILAVGFHRLIQRLVDAGVPMLFLGFRRFVDDGNYLFEQLKSILPETVTAQQAFAAHQRTAEREKVRTGDELGSGTAPEETFSVAPAALKYPDYDHLDRVALGREIARLTSERAKRDAQHQEEIADLSRRAATAIRQAQELAAELEAQRIHTAEAAKQAAEASQQAEDATSRQKAFATELEKQRLRAAVAAKQAEARAIEIDDLRSSTSWRITAWLRWFSTRVVPRA